MSIIHCVLQKTDKKVLDIELHNFEVLRKVVRIAGNERKVGGLGRGRVVCSLLATVTAFLTPHCDSTL